MVKTKSAKGKSKKITWKHIKHPDVDDFFHEQSRDERLGLLKLGEKANEELFFVDQLGFDDDYKELSRKKKDDEFKRRTRNKEGPLVALEELRCFRILKPDSHVKDPVIKRNPVKKGGQKKTLDMKLKDEIRLYKQDLKNKIEPEKVASKSPLDLWADADADNNSLTGLKNPSAILQNEWLTDETKRNLLRNRKIYRPNRKTNEVKPIEVPHPGLSYNPSYKDHQDIILKAVELEKEAMKAEQKLQRATSIPHAARVKPDQDLELELKSEPESDSEDDKSKLKHKLASTKPKTKQQKRKEKEQKEKEMLIKAKKLSSKKESEVFRVKSLRKEIDLKEKKNKVRLQKRVEKIVQRERFGVKTLGRHKFEELKEKPILSGELPQGLININGDGGGNTGDLLLDRFKSLQKRNVIEPRIRQKQKRTYKPKKYVRECDKMEWEKTGIWNGEKIIIQPGNRRPRRSNRN